MGSPTSDEIATLRTLLKRYRIARGYSFRQLGELVNRDAGFLHRLENPEARWRGITGDLALALHRVLRFGEIEPSDRQEWYDATHLTEFMTMLNDIEIEHHTEARLTAYLQRLRLPLYLAVWARARLLELRYEWYTALPLAERAVAQAKLAEAPPRLLAIMLQDLPLFVPRLKS